MTGTNPSTRNLLFRSLALAGLTLLLGVIPASAQTREGVTITNTASVTYDDANGNSYSDDASVGVTVGFSPGIDVNDPAEVTPAAGATDATLVFTITATGNGDDQAQVDAVNFSGDVIPTNVTYFIEGDATEYANLTDLNNALALIDLTQADSDIQVTLQFDVPAGTGGKTGTATMEVSSNRNSGTTDSGGADIKPPLDGSIVVDNNQGDASGLPSNGSQLYTVTFDVTNNLSGDDVFDLELESVSAGITNITINGGSVTDQPIAEGNTATYSVSFYADGTPGTDLNMTFRATGSQGATDTQLHTFTITEPSFSITKQAYRDDKSTLIDTGGGDTVALNEYIQYKVTVTNNDGTHDLSNISVTDDLPTQVAYNATSDDGGSPAWSISESGGTVTATLSSLPAGTSRHFWIRVQIN